MNSAEELRSAELEIAMLTDDLRKRTELVESLRQVLEMLNVQLAGAQAENAELRQDLEVRRKSK